MCVGLGVLLATYAPQISLLPYMKWELRNAAELWVVPAPLRVAANEPCKGRTFSYFGYEFETPWTQVKRERKQESVAALNFSGRQFVTIFDPAQSANELDLMKQSAAKRGVELRAVLGDEAGRSRYALRSWMWNLTPADLRLFSSRQKMASSSVFLTLKKIWMTGIKGGLYSFETSRFRGFQKGGPGQDDVIIIEAFDAQDRKIEIWIGAERGSKNRPSQADINTILYSLRPVSTTQAK